VALGPNDLVFCSAPLVHVPLLDRLSAVRNAGFAGISLLPGDIWTLEQQGMAPAVLSSRIAECGLEVAEVDCIGNWLPSHDFAAGKGDLVSLIRELTPDRVIKSAAAVGARSVTVVEMLQVRPSLDEASEAFAGMCDQAADHGLNVQIEFLPFGGIPDLASARAIIDAAGRDNGRLTIDSWHLFRSGSTLSQLAKIPGRQIGTVQISDAPAIPSADLMNETMFSRLLPGHGALELVSVIRTLDEIGSVAPLGVEVFSEAERTQPVDQIATAWARAAGAIIEEARGGP
jgi:sugar phosphate isomerase/epimerase